MKTRITYHKTPSGLTSNYLLNYEGKRFLVFIHFVSKTQYRLIIINEKQDVTEIHNINTLALAKRTARLLLLNKYNVRMNEEIRQGG
jgi:hypothetical protein